MRIKRKRDEFSREEFLVGYTRMERAPRKFENDSPAAKTQMDTDIETYSRIRKKDPFRERSCTTLESRARRKPRAAAVAVRD